MKVKASFPLSVDSSYLSSPSLENLRKCYLHKIQLVVFEN